MRFTFFFIIKNSIILKIKLEHGTINVTNKLQSDIDKEIIARSF